MNVPQCIEFFIFEGVNKFWAILEWNENNFTHLAALLAGPLPQ